MLDLLKPALDIIYPAFCGGCGKKGSVICPVCEGSFERIDEHESCPLCGRRVGKAVVCGRCMGKRIPLARSIFGFAFHGPLREAMHSFKFSGRRDVGRHLVRLVAPSLRAAADGFDVIVPLPVTPKRLRERGFNQSFVLAEEVAAISGRAIDHASLRKVRETKDQYTLSRDERGRNVRGAFAASPDRGLKGKRVLLIDDLFTTGSTAREAARTLRKAGASSVLLFALARTPE